MGDNLSKPLFLYSTELESSLNSDEHGISKVKRIQSDLKGFPSSVEQQVEPAF